MTSGNVPTAGVGDRSHFRSEVQLRVPCHHRNQYKAANLVWKMQEDGAGRTVVSDSTTASHMYSPTPVGGRTGVQTVGGPEVAEGDTLNYGGGPPTGESAIQSGPLRFAP